MLTPREKRTGLLVTGLIVLKGIGDVISVASIMPFLSLLGSPELVNTNPIANYFYTFFGFESPGAFIIMTGVTVIFFLLTVSILRSITAYALNRWTAMREYSLSLRLLSVYMRQPYEFFLNRRTDELNAFILSEAGRVVKECYKPAGDIINAAITFILIAMFLLWVDPITTLISVLIFGSCYCALYFGLKTALERWGEEVIVTNRERFRVSGEALNGIKQIKLLGRERSYLSSFSVAAERQARVRAITTTLRQIPKFGLETIAFGGIITLSLVLIAKNGGVENGAIENVVPILGLYAIAGYRLLPTMQAIYTSFASLKLGAAAVEAIYDDMTKTSTLEKLPSSTERPLNFVTSIVLKEVSYRYPEAAEGGLKNVSFDIERGTRIGIVGTTGAGKTTLVDVLLGLLPTSGGSIVVDGKPLQHNLIRQWQACIGYVPQDVFLIDASVKENIAFGVPIDEIDDDAVRNAAISAQIHDFVETQLPNGYDTHVGERGVRLSGGQKQRLGIARALYCDPQIIVFDEATSALDNATERELMKEVNALSGEKTVIMIAHRLSTIKNCDCIIVLDKGTIIGKGTYEELVESNSSFRETALLQE